MSSPSQVAKGIGVPVGRAIVGKQGIIHTGINVAVTSNKITFGDHEEWTDKWRTKGHIKWKLDDLEGLVVLSNKRMLVTPTPILRNQEALYDYHGVLPLGAGSWEPLFPGTSYSLKSKPTSSSRWDLGALNPIVPLK